MKIAGMIKNSVVNGEGIRDVLFLQGCKHYCKGCHNPETWNIEDGKEYTIDELLEELKDSNNQVTISGGEPLLQFRSVCELMFRLEREQGKRCWLYTGFRYTELPNDILSKLAQWVDVLVDGRFEIDKKDLTLQFRGSSNQRLIDLPKSVEIGKIVEWRDDND